MRISLLSMSLLGAISSFVTPTMAATSLATNAEIIDAVKKIAPVRSLATTDAAISVIQSPGATDFDGASVGTFAATASSYSYWTFDDISNPVDIYTSSYVGNAWRTFKVTLGVSEWSSTTTLTLAETVRDGAAGPGSPYSLEVVLTKAGTGSPANLTAVNLAAFLAKSTVNNLVTSGGAALTSTSALTTGWTAKALIKDGSSVQVTAAASNPVLDPVAATITVNVTPAGGTAVALAAGLANLHLWNVTAIADTLKDVVFTGSGSRNVTYKVKPASFVRTAGISTGLVAALNASPKLLYQTDNAYFNTLTGSVDRVLGKMAASAPASVNAGLNAIANAKISSTSFDNTAYTTTLSLTPVSVGTGGKLGLIALTDGDIAINSAPGEGWKVSGTVITANGQIGSAAFKDFKCDLTTKDNLNVVTSVLQFTASDGDAFWLKTLVIDGAGSPVLNTSGSTTVAAGNKDDLLAIHLLNTLSATTTIAHKTIDVIASA